MVPIICQGIPGHHLPFLYLSSYFCLPFWVSLSVLRARKILLHKNLFLDQNLNQIDSIILHNFYFVQYLLHWMGGVGGGGDKVAMAVAVVVAKAVASVMLVVQKGLHRHHLMGLRQ